MVKMFFIQKLLKQYQPIVVLSKISYQQNSRALYAFAPNKSFGQLLDISPKHSIFLKTFDSFDYFHTFKYGSPMKILNRQRQKVKQAKHFALKREIQ